MIVILNKMGGIEKYEASQINKTLSARLMDELKENLILIGTDEHVLT